MYMTHTTPARPLLDKPTVSTPAEQKLKLERRGEWLELMIARSESDEEAKSSFESDLAALKQIQKNMLSDADILARCEKLAELKKKHNIRIVDNRSAYSRQTTRAVNAMCGGAA